MIKTGIIGSSGFVGYNILKLLLKHPSAEVMAVVSESQCGKPVSSEFTDLECDLVFEKFSKETLNALDLIFLAVPHGAAKEIAQQLNCRIIDMSADHRLTHTYGIPEFFSNNIRTSKLVANPGCYATTCILAAYPMKDNIAFASFDCISGYSGGGKNAAEKYDYVNNIIAYKLTDHFHKKEIDNTLGFDFSFTPHVVNAFSGLMCTAHFIMKEKCDAVEIQKRYEKFYDNSLTRVMKEIPCTKDITSTPLCHIGGFAQETDTRLVIVSVIDNLMKGAASQAVENMNLMFSLDSKTGLV